MSNPEAKKKPAKAKKQRTTIQKYKFWRNWAYGLEVAKYAMPFIPFGVILGINWQEWFGQSESESWSIGIGFGMLIVAAISSIIAVIKKDELAKSKVTPILYVSIIFMTIGMSFKLLASIVNQFGDMFLYVSIGILASACVDEFSHVLVAPRINFYKKLVDENGLSKNGARSIEDIEQAKREGEDAKAERMKQKNYL